MYGIVQNKNYVTIYRFYGVPLLSLEYKVYATQEDFDDEVNGVQKTAPLKTTGIQSPGGTYTLYESAYGLRVNTENSQEVAIVLDGNSEKQALEEKMRDAVLAEWNQGIILPYSDLFKLSVEVVNTDTGETIEILEGDNGNTWTRRLGIYIPSSGILAGKPCMRLGHSSSYEYIISKENKETSTNNQTVRLSTQRPYTIFISGLQVPHIEYSLNSLFIDSEDYSKTYYYTYT